MQLVLLTQTLTAAESLGLKSSHNFRAMPVPQTCYTCLLRVGHEDCAVGRVVCRWLHPSRRSCCILPASVRRTARRSFFSCARQLLPRGERETLTPFECTARTCHSISRLDDIVAFSKPSYRLRQETLKKANDLLAIRRTTERGFLARASRLYSRDVQQVLLHRSTWFLSKSTLTGWTSSISPGPPGPPRPTQLKCACCRIETNQ